MKTLLRLLLKSQHQRNRSEPDQTDKGMTLVELLVGAILAFLIITPMIGFVVEMLNSDRREQVKSNTEQDVQAALDFIAQDLSQALYIYDNNPATANTTATGIPALLADDFIPPSNQTQTPILVFWKRELIKNSMPLAPPTQPNDCTKTSTGANCNDTYVLALVAYYEVREANPIWCQPAGIPCPTRIVRYQIKDGVKNPSSADPNNPYYSLTDPTQFPPDKAFDKDFDISKPTENVTTGAQNFQPSEVLVNYIDHSQGPTPTGTECRTALGHPTATTGVTPTPLPETTLKITNPTTNSFYACVDTSKNIASVTIRGNSLRRIQTNADYDLKRVAYFPTASVQVQGLGGRGK